MNEVAWGGMGGRGEGELDKTLLLSRGHVRGSLSLLQDRGYLGRNGSAFDPAVTHGWWIDWLAGENSPRTVQPTEHMTCTVDRGQQRTQAPDLGALESSLALVTSGPSGTFVSASRSQSGALIRTVQGLDPHLHP